MYEFGGNWYFYAGFFNSRREIISPSALTTFVPNVREIFENRSGTSLLKIPGRIDQKGAGRVHAGTARNRFYRLKIVDVFSVPPYSSWLSGYNRRIRWFPTNRQRPGGVFPLKKRSSLIQRTTRNNVNGLSALRSRPYRNGARMFST